MALQKRTSLIVVGVAVVAAAVALPELAELTANLYNTSRTKV
ncbi:hypothetical protein [Streptomyces sp. V1I1]|nr:hypothetical protein [Streptomyces sp. V1I1]